MENITLCALCGSDQAEKLYDGRDRLHHQPGDFAIMQCSNCKLVYLSPRPSGDEMDRYYPQDYIAYPTAVEDERSWWRRLDRGYGITKRCKKVLHYAPTPGRILDVGCATGLFLHGMQQRGWQAYGVEPTAYAANYAQTRFQLDVQQTYLENTHYEDNFFDVVTLWDVLEHVPAPEDTLREIQRILKPGGLLLLGLPNPDAWERYWFGKYWAGWDVPRHFHIFTRDALQKFLARTGFEIEDVICFTGRHGVLVLCLEFWMTDWNVSPRVKRFLLSVAKSLPARLLTYPFYAIADRLVKSSDMTVLARKRSK